MSDHPRPTRLSRLLARCYPRELREQYADDIARFIDDARRDAQRVGNPLGAVVVAGSLTRDALLSLFASVRHGAPRPLRTRAPNPSLVSRFRSYRMETLLQDIKYALRGFLRRPGFTAVALLTLTLGIGGTSAVFTLVNAVLLESLPYPNPDQLVYLTGADATARESMLSAPDVMDMRARNRTFQDIGILRTQSVNLTGGDRPDRVIGNFVSAGTLKLLGANTVLGRVFSEDETTIGAGDQVAVISYATWQTRFGGRANIIGEKLILNGNPHTVIGVTSEKFRDPITSDLWLPISSAPSRGWLERNAFAVTAVGRLKPGITIAEGQKDLGSVAAQLAAEYHPGNPDASVSVVDMRETLVGGSRFTLTVLFCAVIAVLLIACVNIANLQLVRASTRQREMSIRAAMGANRTRLVSQTLVESLILALGGGALGVIVGQFAAKALVRVVPPNVPVLGDLQPDARVIAFAFAMALLTGLLFGAPAAFAGTRRNLQGALRARNDLTSTGRMNLRNVLVVSELALCVVLLAVAGLFTRSMQSLQNVAIGFNPAHVLSAEFRLPSVKYDNDARIRQFMRSALVELRSVPGVTTAAYVGAVPLSGNYDRIPYAPQGQPDVPADQLPMTLRTTISDQYFRTMQIPLLAGRDFNANDVNGNEPVAIVNQLLADRAWPGENAIGKTILLRGHADAMVRVVGVVGGIKQFTLTENNEPQLYVSIEQNPGIFTSVVMRTMGDPDAMSRQLHAAIWAIDSDQPIWKVRSLQFLVDRDLSSTTVAVGIISAFALLALLLGAVGVYGVMSFAVQQRSREMGIRMALGARTSQVLTLVLRGGLEVVIVALLIGTAGAMTAGQFIQSRLYQIAPSDPATMIGVPLVLGVVALMACWLPARRAARVDPAVTLRSE